MREATRYGARLKYLIRDHDGKFGTEFDEVAKRTETGAADSGRSERDGAGGEARADPLLSRARRIAP